MEDLIENVARGNVTEVKVVLATVIVALALYQLLLAAVAYGWVRLPFLESATASWTHRASGDAILILTVLVATACIAYYGFDEGGASSRMHVYYRHRAARKQESRANWGMAPSVFVTELPFRSVPCTSKL